MVRSQAKVSILAVFWGICWCTIMLIGWKKRLVRVGIAFAGPVSIPFVTVESGSLRNLVSRDRSLSGCELCANSMQVAGSFASGISLATSFWLLKTSHPISEPRMICSE